MAACFRTSIDGMHRVLRSLSHRLLREPFVPLPPNTCVVRRPAAHAMSVTIPDRARIMPIEPVNRVEGLISCAAGHLRIALSCHTHYSLLLKT
jgi:hypothetical protein